MFLQVELKTTVTYICDFYTQTSIIKKKNFGIPDFLTHHSVSGHHNFLYSA